MIGIVEYAIFGVAISLNFGLGLYFSLRRKARAADTTTEMFLGSRALRSIPLAASIVASRISSITLVGFTGHFYAYGFHLVWHSLNTFVMTPVVAFLFLPVFYGLRVTSVFEGGLRGVVWTDCMQLFFILLGPTTVIAKVIVDSGSSIGAQRAFHELDIRRYIANVTFDIGHDENVWSSLLASASVSLYRVGLDQVAVQRCMASRSLSDAKRTLLMGSVMLMSVYVVNFFLVFAMVVWFWGCDPKLSGAITFLLGVVMTACSCACPYLGTITRGAGIATLLMVGFQLVVMWQSVQSGAKPPPMPVMLEYCRENVTSQSNVTTLLSTPSPQSTSFRLSSFWSGLISTCGTVILGVIISVATEDGSTLELDVKLTWYQRCALWILQLCPIPRHVVVMPDGHRRYSRRTSSDLGKSYNKGLQNSIRVCRLLETIGVTNFTALLCSNLNFKRSAPELQALFSAFDYGCHVGLQEM
ncbi:hypothetical protein MTO96_031531 [Rhipicephalus appendiculatus]